MALSSPNQSHKISHRKDVYDCTLCNVFWSNNSTAMNHVKMTSYDSTKS